MSARSTPVSQSVAVAQPPRSSCALCHQFLPELFSSVLQKQQFLSQWQWPSHLATQLISHICNALCNQFLPKVFSSVLQKHQYLSGSGSGPATMQPNQYPKYLQSQLNKLEKICLSSPQNTAMCFMILFVDLRPCDLDPG